jgi:MFS family permease
MGQIKSVKDFANSRFTVCTIISLLSLWLFLGSTELSGEQSYAYFTVGFLLTPTFIGYIFALMMIVPVLCGHKFYSLGFGLIAFAFGTGTALFSDAATIHLMPRRFFALSICYLGLFVMLNWVMTNGATAFFTLFISRFFIGFCLCCYAVMRLSKTIGTLYLLTSMTTNRAMMVSFIIGAICLFFGILLMFGGRIYSTLIAGIGVIVTVFLIAVQIPALIINIINDNYIEDYFNNVISSPVVIVTLILYLALGMILLLNGRSKIKKLYPKKADEIQSAQIDTLPTRD